ncbi:MAG: AbrB/MazE/SpoVT family DNA-binding domain-containing protein [Armatimonadetes bacterium]|nr:AbrB/MazE/SpoVT family DNA-binding domain-containing protein [Armatimonadota bacterium]
MALVRTSRKGQILIPKKLRQKVGIEPGALVHLQENHGQLLIRPVPQDPIGAACGFLKGDFSLTEDLLREREVERDREEDNRS